MRKRRAAHSDFVIGHSFVIPHPAFVIPRRSRIHPERAVAPTITRARRAAVARVALREPVKARIAADARLRRAMLRTPPPQPHRLLPALAPPQHLRRRRRVAARAAARRALEEGFGGGHRELADCGEEEDDIGEAGDDKKRQCDEPADAEFHFHESIEAIQRTSRPKEKQTDAAEKAPAQEKSNPPEPAAGICRDEPEDRGGRKKSAGQVEPRKVGVAARRADDGIVVFLVSEEQSAFPALDRRRFVRGTQQCIARRAVSVVHELT